MQSCHKCGIQITGDRVRCPLCQGEVSGTGQVAEEVFPHLPDHTGRYHLIIRMMVFLSVAAVVICSAIAIMIPQPVVWAWYVAAAVACMWLCLANVLWRRHNIPKNILWMVFWLSLLSYAWDYFTGMHNWALNYAIPIICIAAMGAVSVVARVIGLHLQEYFIYVILVSLFGVLPSLFVWLGWATVPIPSVICVACSLLSLSAVIVFQGEQLLGEIKKRLHL